MSKNQKPPKETKPPEQDPKCEPVNDTPDNDKPTDCYPSEGAHQGALISADVEIGLCKDFVDISADVLSGHSLLDLDVDIA